MTKMRWSGWSDAIDSMLMSFSFKDQNPLDVLQAVHDWYGAHIPKDEEQLGRLINYILIRFDPGAWSPLLH